MKKIQTIDQLKEEGLVITVDKFVYPPKKGCKSKKGGFKLIPEVIKNLPYPLELDPAFDAEKINKQLKRIECFEEIEAYCNSNGLIPVDLINFHRELSKPKVKAKNSLKIEKADRSDFFNNLRKNKTGYSE